MLTKVREYKVRQNGKSGLQVIIPAEFASDMKMKPGDVIEFYREGNTPALLLKLQRGKSKRIMD
jgi:bifunctional DNA-binding transcriptional regulator/antitoxin component of YhaV-PrlF toxin-antitoxin module